MLLMPVGILILQDFWYGPRAILLELRLESPSRVLAVSICVHVSMRRTSDTMSEGRVAVRGMCTPRDLLPWNPGYE